MIRKALIMVLVILAIPLWAVVVYSYKHAIRLCRGGRPDENSVVVRVDRGRVTVISFMPSLDLRMSEVYPPGDGPPSVPPQPPPHEMTQWAVPGLSYASKLDPLLGGASYGSPGEKCYVYYRPTSSTNALRTTVWMLWLDLLAAPVSVYPVIAFVRGPWRRMRRRRKGLCRHCGYNLVGNVSGVCPECGKPAT